MSTLSRKFIDNGDGTISEVVILGGSAASSAIGKVDHTTGSLGDGRKVVTAAATAEALAASTPAKWVTITAEDDNTGVIVVGGPTVVAALATRRGKPLAAGADYHIPIDNLADIFLDTTVNGDGVTYTYGIGA